MLTECDLRKNDCIYTSKNVPDCLMKMLDVEKEYRSLTRVALESNVSYSKLGGIRYSNAKSVKLTDAIKIFNAMGFDLVVIPNKSR